MFPAQIPQQAEDFEDWERFLYKAARGSWKAANMLLGAEVAFLLRFAGEDAIGDATVSEQEAILHSLILAAPPFRDVATLARTLVQDGYAPPRFQLRPGPLNDARAYQDVWKRTAEGVDALTLLHDAVLQAYSSWSPDDYLRLANANKHGYYTGSYNSRDAVAAMLMLLGSWAVRAPEDWQRSG